MVRRTVSNGKPPKAQVRKPVTPKNQPKGVVYSNLNEVQKILDSHTRHLVKIDQTLSALVDQLGDIKKALVTETVKPKAILEKKKPDQTWYSQIEPDREYSQKEIIAITKISQPTLSMAKVRGHIVTRSPPGERGWVVKGSDLIAWDSARAIYHRKSKTESGRSQPKKMAQDKKTVKVRAKPVTTAVSIDSKRGKSPLVIQKKERKSLTVQEKPSPRKIAPVKKMAAELPVMRKATSTVVEKKVSTAKSIKKPSGRVKRGTGPAAVKKDQQIPIPDDIPDRITALTMKKVVTQTQFGIDVGLPQKAIYEITSRKLNVLNPAIIQKIITTLKSYESR